MSEYFIKENLVDSKHVSKYINSLIKQYEKNVFINFSASKRNGNTVVRSEIETILISV